MPMATLGEVEMFYEETGAGLDESRLEVSPGSGPYMIDSVDVNRRIVYKRNPDYWGKDLPFNYVLDLVHFLKINLSAFFLVADLRITVLKIIYYFCIISVNRLGSLSNDNAGIIDRMIFKVQNL